MHECYGAAALRSQAMGRFAVTLVVATILGLSGVAPAGAVEAVDPSDWGDGFCTALTDWQTSAVSARDVVDDVLDNGVANTTKAKAARKKLVRALKGAGGAAEDAGDSISELGPPDVPKGAKISKTASAAMYDIGDVFADAADDAAKFSTEPKKFEQQVKALKKQVDAGLDQAGEDISAIDTLDGDGTLDAALSAEPACASLSSS
jgi:ABC-type transporter Mla subunit MlaD